MSLMCKDDLPRLARCSSKAADYLLKSLGRPDCRQGGTEFSDLTKVVPKWYTDGGVSGASLVASIHESEGNEVVQKHLKSTAANVKRVKCIRCGEPKPRDDQHFPKNPRMRDGLANRCKACAKKARQEKHPLKIIQDEHHAPNGKFKPGNKANPRGNSMAGQTARARAIFQRILTDEQLWEIGRKWLKEAKAGNVAIAREMLDRAFGKPTNWETVEWLEQVEKKIEERLKAEKPVAEPAK